MSFRKWWRPCPLGKGIRMERGVSLPVRKPMRSFGKGLLVSVSKGYRPYISAPISAGRRPVAANLEEYAGKMRLDGLVGATVSPQVRPEKFIFFICKRWYNKISIIRIKEHIT